MNNIKKFENFNIQYDIFKYIKNNDIQLVKKHIDFGYDLNIENSLGYTPLILATLHNRIKIIELLLNVGANVDKPDDDTSKPDVPNDGTSKPNKPNINPQTGDVASVGLLQSIIVGSTSILALLLGNRKKRKR